jgi:hypothetical protein
LTIPGRALATNAKAAACTFLRTSPPGSVPYCLVLCRAWTRRYTLAEARLQNRSREAGLFADRGEPTGFVERLSGDIVADVPNERLGSAKLNRPAQRSEDDCSREAEATMVRVAAGRFDLDNGVVWVEPEGTVALIDRMARPARRWCAQLKPPVTGAIIGPISGI